jgi:hypothetical protein
VTLARKDVDPAALLIAVFVAVTAEAASPGLWDYLDTIVAVAVLAILVAYSFPTIREQGPLQLGALSVVIGVVFAVAISWLVQGRIVIPYWSARHDTENAIADRAILISLGFAVPVILIVLFFARRGRRAPDANGLEDEMSDLVTSLKQENERLRKDVEVLKQSVAFWVREQSERAEPPSQQ